MDYWLSYAKDYAVGIGLRLDENATDSWDTPIRCSSKTEDVLAAYIRDDLTYYKNEEGCTAVWIWAEQVGDGGLLRPRAVFRRRNGKKCAAFS